MTVGGRPRRRVAALLVAVLLATLLPVVPARAVAETPGELPTPCVPGGPQPCFGRPTDYGELTLSKNVVREGDLIVARWSPAQGGLTPIWPPRMTPQDEVQGLNNRSLVQIGECPDGALTCSYRVVFSDTCVTPFDAPFWGAFTILVAKEDGPTVFADAPIWFEPEMFNVALRVEDPDGVAIETTIDTVLERPAFTVTTYDGDTVLGVRRRAGLGSSGTQITTSIPTHSQTPYLDLRAHNPTLDAYFGADHFPAGVEVQIPAIWHRSFNPFPHVYPGIWEQPGSNFGCFRRGTWTLTVSAPGYRATETITFTLPDTTKTAGHAEITARLQHPLEPRPDFTWTELTPGMIRFEDTSQRGNGGSGPPIVLWEWGFGDGANGIGPAPMHDFALPGDYIVGLTVTDGNDLQNTAYKTVTVAAPELDITIEGNFVDRPVGAVVPVTVTVSASEGLGALSGLRFLDSVLRATPAASATVGGFSAPDTFELQPGEERAFQGTVTLDAAGSIQFSSRVLGQDAAGRDVDKLALKNAAVEPPGLKVTVSGAPCARAIAGTPPRCVVDFLGHGEDQPVDLTLEVTVENTSTTDPITNVVIDEGLVLSATGSTADGINQMAGPLLDGEPLAGGILGDLEPGASKVVTYKVRVTTIGRYQAEATAHGDVADPGGGGGDPGGGPAGFGPLSLGLASVNVGALAAPALASVLTAETTRISASGRLAIDAGDELVVTITPSKNDFQLPVNSKGQPQPEEIDVVIAVKNVTESPIANVKLGPLDLAAADPERTYHPFPAHVTGGNELVEIGTIGPDETKTVTRKLTVTGDGHMKLTSLVTSDGLPAQGEKALTTTVRTLLTLTVEGDPTRQVFAGSGVTFSGSLRNVSNDRTVALTDPVKVRREGNVIGGGTLAEVGGDSPFPRPLITTLEPGQEVAFQVVMRTERPTIADYDQGTDQFPDWTRATVDFNVWVRAAVEEDDDTWAALGTEEQCFCEYPESIVLEGGDFGAFTIEIETTELVSDGGQFGSAAFGLSLGALEGAQRRLSGLLGYALKAGEFVLNSEFRDEVMSNQLIKGRLKDSLDYLAEIAVWLPAAEAEEVEQTVALHLSDAYDAFTETVTGGIPRPENSPTSDAIVAMTHDYVRKLQGAWRRGDPNQLIDAVMPVGGIVGEQLTDALLGEVVFEALAHMTTLPRYYDLAKQNWADARTIEQMQDKLPSLAQQADLLEANELAKSNFVNLENAYQARRELTIPELGGADNGAGLSRDTIQTSLQWSRDNPNQLIVVIPNEPAAAALRDAGLAVGKIENIKPKSMSTIEYLVFGGRAEDKNVVLLRKLNWTDSQVDDKVSQLIAAGDLAEEDRAVAKQILKKRNEEWQHFSDRGIKDPTTGAVTPDPGGIGKLKAYDETGKIPNQFRGEDNNVAFSGPEQQLDFKLEYYKDGQLLPKDRIGEADYVVLLQEHPRTGRLVKIVGDDDGIFIGFLNGLGLPGDRLAAAYRSIWEAFNHPFSDTWLAHIGAQAKAKLKIFSRYFATTSEGTAGAPLVAFVNGKAFAVKIDPYLSRFDPLNNRAFIKWIGLPQAVDAVNPAGWVNAVRRTVANIPWPATFLRSFLHIPGAATDPDIPPIPSAKRARVLRVNDVGHVESWTPTAGWQLSPEAEAEAGAGTVAVAPQTQVIESTEAGAIRVEISSQAEMGLAGDWFEVGDLVVLDPGGPHEETGRIDGFGSLVFEEPLQFPHEAGELITFLSAATDTTPPVITFSGLRAYRLLETVTVTCAFADEGSGIDTSACTVPAPAPAWTFGPGLEPVSAAAIDNAGNPNLAEGAFTVSATFDDLCTLTEQFSSKKNEKDLCNHLEHAEKAAAKGKAKDVAREIDKYVKAVEKERKAFTAAERAVLVEFARSL